MIPDLLLVHRIFLTILLLIIKPLGSAADQAFTSNRPNSGQPFRL